MVSVEFLSHETSSEGVGGPQHPTKILCRKSPLSLLTHLWLKPESAVYMGWKWLMHKNCEVDFQVLFFRTLINFAQLLTVRCESICQIFLFVTSATLEVAAAAAAKSLQSCLTLCDPIDGGPPGSPVPGILQARTLERVAISFSSGLHK